MHLAKSLALVIPFLTLIACSGGIQRLGPGDGGGDDGPNPNCPAASSVDNGVSCGDPGLSCPGAYGQPQCNGPGIPVQCTCTSGQWQCPVLSGGISCPPPPTSCPPPSLVSAGSYCSTDSTLSCQSNIPIQGCNGTTDGYVSCNCYGNSWSCPEPGAPFCPIDASVGCPPPDSTYAGQTCANSGITCGGDPQTCGSQTVYDALQCQAGVWTVVASTSCDVDGGSIDAQWPDGGVGD